MQGSQPLFQPVLPFTTPMPRFDQLEIVDPAGHIQFVDLDPAVGLLNIGTHPDNDVALQGPGVRPFHALLDFRSRPYQILLLDESGAGERSAILDQWHSARVGNFELLLAAVDGTEPAIAMPPSTTKLPAVPVPVRPSAPKAANTVPVQSGPATAPVTGSHFALTLNNSGALPATFHVSVLDVAPQWILVEPAQCYLQPNQQTQVTLTLHPELPPGGYTFTWQITSPDYGDWQQSGQTTLVSTTAYQSIEWAELDPRLVRSQLFRRSGRAVLALTNRGTQPARYFLWAKDLRGDCVVRFGLSAETKQIISLTAPKADQCEVLLPPGVVVPIEMTISPAEGRIIALRTLRYRFVIQGGFNPGGAVDRAITGTFESRPAINGSWLLLLFMTLLVAAIFLFRSQIDGWIDSWRFAQAGPPSLAAMPTPERIHGFTAEELARYRQDNGTGGQEAVARPTLDSYEAIFKEIGERYNVDWRLLAALAYRESRLDPDAVGGSGEYGLMQIMPPTWNEWAPLVQVNDPWDPYSNVLVGAAYYSYIHGYFTDIGFTDERWAIAAYNLGPERVLRILDNGARWGDIPLPQRQYTADILMGMDEAPAQVARIDAKD